MTIELTVDVPNQDEWELIELLTVIKELDPKIYVEIGTYYGAGLEAVSKVIPKARLIGIDNNTLESHVDSAQCVKERGIKNATILTMNSQLASTMEALKRELNGEPIDFLFIDGNHMYEAVQVDWYYHALVRKGGIVALHDINPPDPGPNVRDLWKELKTRYKTTEILNPNNIGCLGVGLVWL